MQHGPSPGIYCDTMRESQAAQELQSSVPRRESVETNGAAASSNTQQHNEPAIVDPHGNLGSQISSLTLKPRRSYDIEERKKIKVSKV